MGPQEDYIETVLTCEGDYYDPEFHRGLEHFSQKLESLINADNGKLILKKVEPWNSVRVTFNIPKEAAVRLKQLAEQGDNTLKDLGILAVQIQGDRSISLTIAGKNNETTELIFRTTSGPSANSTVFDSSAEDLLPGPSNLEATRANIAECLRAQSEAGSHLVNVFMRQQQPQVPPSVTIPTNQVNQPALYGSPSRSPSHSASSAGSQLPVPQGKSPPGFPSPSQSVSQQSFPSPGSSRSQPSPVSPQYPTPPPSQPSHPSSPGIRSNSLAYTHHHPTANNVQGLRLNKDITSASPLLVNLLQTEVSHQQQQQHFNSIPQLPMPPPFDGGPAVKKRKRSRKKDRLKIGLVEGEISVPGLPLPTGSETRVPPIAGSDNFMQQSPSPHGDGNLHGLASSLTASLSQPSTPSSQQAHSWVRHASSPSQVSGNVTPPVVLHHNNKNVRCSPDKPTNPQHMINPYTGQLEPVDIGGVSADNHNMVIKTEASDTFGDVSSQLKPPPNPLVAIQQHMAASENSGQQHRVSSPSSNTSSCAVNSGSFLSGLPMSQMPRLPPYPSSTKPKPLHRSGSPANAGSMTLPGSTNTGSMGYSSVLSGLKRSSSGLFSGSHGSSPSSSSQVPTTTSNPRHRFSPVTSLTSAVSGSSSLVSTVSSVLSGEKNHFPESRAIPNSPSDSQGRVRSNCGMQAQSNSSVTQGISIPSDRLLTVTSVASQVANVMSYPTNSERLSRSAACSPVQGLQKSRNIHSQSPTASLSLSVSQTLSAYPDRTLSASLLPSFDSSDPSDLRPSSTPLSSRSSTPKIKSEHESVTAMLSHFIPIPKDNPENFIPNPVKVKEEPVSKESMVKDSHKTVTATGEYPSNTTASQVGYAGIQRSTGGGFWPDQHLKRRESKSPSCGPTDPGLSSKDSKHFKSGTPEAYVLPGLPVTTAPSLSEAVSNVSASSNRPEQQPNVRPNVAVENQEPGCLSEGRTKAEKSNNDNNLLVPKQEIPTTLIPERTKSPGDNNTTKNDGGVKYQSNHHSDVSAKTPSSPHQNKSAMEDSHGMNNIDTQPHSKDANNCHNAVSDRLFDGKLLDVPPLLNADQGVGISSVTQSDLQTIPRGSNGASLGEASPLSSDNASSTGQPNAGQSPITNMIGHLNHDSELSSHSFEDHVTVNSEESNNVPTRHNGGRNNKDRDSVPPQHPSQADHKNIITVGYAISKDSPVDLNNGFTNDKLLKNLNNVYLAKSFLENNDVKGVRISTDFLRKERINSTLVRRNSQESDGERYRVKPSLMTENHLNLTSCLSLPAKLLGKSDLNPGGLPVDKPAVDTKINGSSPSESAKSVSSVVTNPSECSINGSLSGENHDNGLPSRKSPLSKDVEQNGGEASGRNQQEEEKDQKSRSLAQTVMIISPPSLRTPEKLLPNLHMSKNESSLPSSHATVWAGSKVALLPASDGEPAIQAELTADLTPNTGSSSTDNLAPSRTVITPASSASLVSTGMAIGSEASSQSLTENWPTSCPSKVPSSLPSLIPADKSTGSGLLSAVQTPSQLAAGKTNGLGCSVSDESQEVTLHMKKQDVTEKLDTKKTVDGILKSTPNGDHPGITGLLAHHSKVAVSKGISILKPLHDRDEERDDDLMYSSDKMKSLSDSLIAGQDNLHKVAHSDLVVNAVLGEEDKTSKDVRVSLPSVVSPHSKVARSNSYSKTNPKSSFSDFPANNASRLSSFVNKSIHTPVHNSSTSRTITAPGFHLNLTESVQRVIPSMDTLSPPHDKATFSLSRMNQSPPVNLSPPAAEKKSPTQKVHSGNATLESVKTHSGKVTPELPASEDLRNDHYLAMAQRIYARTTASVVNTLGSKPVTTVSSSVYEQASPNPVATATEGTAATSSTFQDQLAAVKSEPVAMVCANPVSSTSGTCASYVNTDTSPTIGTTTCVSSASVVTKNEKSEDSGTVPVSASTESDYHNTDSVTVTPNAPESVKLETEIGVSLETQTVPVAAMTEIVPLKSESVRTVECVTTAADGSESKLAAEGRFEASPAKVVEVVARQSRRLQAKMEQTALEHEESGPGRPVRIRKYSTESIRSESSEIHAEGMSTRSGRARRASTESSISEEQGQASRMTRCSSRESAESRSGSRESGHGKEESPKGTMTLSRKTSGSSDDLIEERRARLGELRTSTPSPTPRATRTSTRSVRKKVPEGFVDTSSATKTACDAESGSKTRGGKRRLVLDEHDSESPPDNKKAKVDDAGSATYEEAVKGKANAKNEKTAVGLDSVASSVANRVRGKQDVVKPPMKEAVTPQKVSPSKENVADEHSYSNKKPGKAKPATVVKKPVIVEQKTPVAKTRQTGRSKSPVPEPSGRNRSSKQPVVEEKVTSSSTASGASTPGAAPVKRSTRSTRTKEVADSANTPSAAGKRRRVSRDQR